MPSIEQSKKKLSKCKGVLPIKAKELPEKIKGAQS
jgi:hypothetical protein